MNTEADQLEQRLITTARAYVRIIEVADLLPSRNPVCGQSGFCCDWCGHYTRTGCVG